MTNHQPSQPPTVAIALIVAFFLSLGFMGIVAAVLPGPAIFSILKFGFFALLFFVAQYFLLAKWMLPLAKRLEQEQHPESSDNPAPTEEWH